VAEQRMTAGSRIQVHRVARASGACFFSYAVGSTTVFEFGQGTYTAYAVRNRHSDG
jgi:hypothetical protein